MQWLDPILDRLSSEGPVGYGPQQSACTEPTALSALALLSYNRPTKADPLLDWLQQTQLPDGSVPMRRDPPRPAWPTALASLAWTLASRITGENPHRFQKSLDRSAAAMLAIEGETSPRQPQFGHDSTLVGWPWVSGTHTWLEPTIFHVLALSARGWSTHARVVAGRRVIADRLLPTGGANYGNTVVLGQTLLPHIQPSGMALLALNDRPPNARVRGTIEYLKSEIKESTTPASLCWGLMGLYAFGVAPLESVTWLQQAATREGLSAHDAALIALAALEGDNPLIRMPREAAL